MNKIEQYKAVDFFCGGGGMTCGLREAGINVLAGIDFDASCKKTYEFNNPGAVFIDTDITIFKASDLADKIEINKNDDNLIFVGCSPCQYWSILNTNKVKAEKSKNLIEDFQRFIEYYKPGYVLVENVPGIIRNKEESALPAFLEFLDKNGYKGEFDIINMNDYGVPQGRKRFSLIYSRVNRDITLPDKSNKKHTVSDFIGEKNGFAKIEAGHRDESDFMHWSAKLIEKNIQRLKQTSANGSIDKDWQEDLKLPSRKNGKVFTDVYGRMDWKKPAPTITTKFISLSNGRFGHPEENRALSLREGAVLQTFPKDYKFIGSSFGAIAKMIGNAVPPEYARRLGERIISNRNKSE